ncbi:MAG: bifunctional pyr operon transcriptional regulator/uracil phosphoribosyltransferase PyrR [Pseudarcicella sp.]|jgi:pyrimidine operon attenuation protein/uracil phosphoribosyltransferase|nr:bifunctional pyr operon transcriptional regulator/uracil phosphoribosyltransferase PyrR [Pseudarcicella sp.]MBP6411011.1 bifunctional pyr operon transcriptional regulator/uracil phosphoribosyltransferase PyrR [Pseudarcicella sp.]
MLHKTILSGTLFGLTISRICQELIENHQDFENSVLLGLQPRGTFFANRIHQELLAVTGKNIQIGTLDATFYRDDYRRRDMLSPNTTKIPFLIESKKVILIDDVLATGRMVRAALDAMTAFGRPEKIELCVMIDRMHNRDIPIKADYFGKKVITIDSEKVLVEWTEQGHNEDKIVLITE